MCLRMEIAPPSQRRKVAAKNEQEDHEKIEKLELQIKDLQIEVAFVREEAAQVKLYLRLTDIIDLKTRSEAARLKSWDVFKSLYTLDSATTELCFMGQRVNNEGAVIVANTLPVFSSLRALDLSNNQISREGMEALSITLNTKTQLMTLNMQDNKLGDDSMGILANVLNHVPLKSLNLGLNDIRDQGVAVISGSLHQEMPAAGTLASLNLCQNKIGPIGCLSIAQALLQNTSLKMLNLADNALGDDGATHLSHMLRINDGIVDLNLSNTGICENGTRELASAVVENTALKTLRMVDNVKMGVEGTKALTTLQKTMALSRELRVYF